MWTAEVAGEVLEEGDRVMHPSHGVGRVVRIAVEEVSGREGSFSERRLYEAALDRLAGEVAAVQGVGKEAAVAGITAQLASAAA